MQSKYEAMRRDAYTEGETTYRIESKNPNFNDFMVVYICEGYKRNKNMVQVTNSDPAIIQLCHPFVKNKTTNKMSYFVQVHHDDNADEIQKFWADTLNIPRTDIKVHLRAQKKSNRKGKLPHGIFTFRVGDTHLRMNIEAWIYLTKKGWSGRRDSNSEYHVPKTCGIANYPTSRC